MHPVRCRKAVEGVIGRENSQKVGEGYDASASVAAHHTAASVGIIVLHSEIQLGIVEKHHKSVCAEAATEILDVYFERFSRVKHYETVSGAGVNV